MMSATVRAMREDDLSLVLEWRNHPEIRRFMYKQHEITPQEHHIWFKSSQANPARSLLIFEYEAVSLGFINITQSTPDHIADWGFYLAPGSPRGTGLLLGRTTLSFAFQTLRLHKICGQALAFNERSIRFHLRLGFTKEAELRDQYYDGERYHDVIHFGLLCNEWRANQREVLA